MITGSLRGRWNGRSFLGLDHKRRASLEVRQRARRGARVEFLEPRHLLATMPLISEFVAGNSGGLQDADGDSSDWIEIYNPTAAAINLQNWSLTDDAGDLNEWVFPAVTLGANQFLTVFASGKDRTTGPELHTNFKLSSSGDYLALVDPSGTVAHEYAPGYPTQLDNVSYGIGFDTAQLISSGATAQVLVPANGSLGTSWTANGFNPTGWTTGTTGVGFGISHPGFNIKYVKTNVTLSDLGVARTVLATPAQQTQVVDTTANVVNFMGTGGGGHYGSDLPFPTQTINEDINTFIVQGTGTITIPTTGNWTFAVNSDDGFELKLQRGATIFTSEYFGLRGASDTLATFNIPAAGDWQVTVTMFENGGGSSFEFFAAPGSQGSWSAAAFDLVGDTANGGLAVVAPIGVGNQATSVGLDTRASMQNINASAYVRIPFNVTNPSAYDALLFSMQYDDGFVAYLNGTVVASRNAPGTLAFNSAATADRTLAQATTAEQISLTPFMNLLQPGTNVLSIQGLNSSAADDSFLVLPQLVASAVHPEQLRYFNTVTPQAPNINPALGVIDRVTANVAAGFYSSPITVTLATMSLGATIRYTTDGSEPTATNGTVYAAPLTIATTTPLRAGAFRTNYLSMPTITRSYLFLNDILLQSPSDDIAGGVYPDVGAPPPGWPATWGSNVVDYGMDQTVINQAGSANVKAALLAMPSLSITTDLANLFNPTTGIYANPSQDGRDWERPASVELVNPDGSAGFQVNAGVRIRGGYSRSTDNPKHSFRLFFRGEYGDSTLDYPLFGDEGVDQFKKFDLRTAQNYSWSFAGDASNTMIQDGFARQSQGEMGQPYSRSKWVHLYLDGQYWGVYQIEERPEAEFAASYLGGDADNYDVIKPEAGVYTNYATDGNQDAYQRLWQFVTTQNLADNANYFHLQGKNAQGINDPSIPNADVLLDVDNLIVYMIGILHGGNLDAPISAFLGNNGINNYFAIRDRTGREGFTFVQHDAEHTLRNVNENRNGPFGAGATFDRFNPQYLHQQLMANAEYKLRFADLVQQFFFGDGEMTATAALARYEKDVVQLDQAIIGESARWGDAKRQTSPLTRTDWLNALNSQRSFLTNRNAILLAQFNTNGLFPAVVAPQYLVNGVLQSEGDVVPGSTLRFSAPAGMVYYTTNGTDPRLLGGGINPAAQIYNPSITTNTLVPTNSNWKYYDRGTDQGTGWRANAFNDTAWASGNAEFGYGDGDEATIVSSGPNGNFYPTTYFRKSFTVSNISDLTALKLRIKRDDGAVIYINGNEVARSNMPATSISYTTLASSNVGTADESTFFEVDLNPNVLQAGVNVIAIEVHQSSATSSDVSFDASLIASQQASPGVTIGASTNYRARTLNGTTWSAESDADFNTAAPASAANLAITEVHYNPAAMDGATTLPLSDKQNFEFIELRNVGTAPINLAGVQFVNGITFNFSTGDVKVLQPGQHVVVIKDRVAFEARYGTTYVLGGVTYPILIAGVYTGSLDNGGEQIRLTDAAGGTIQDFVYDDDPTAIPPWPTAPDGGGVSLNVLSVTGNYDVASNWRAGFTLNGTPGYEENSNLIVTAVTPTSTGFTIDFNRDLGQSQLNMYDSQGIFGPTDIVLSGATTGNVRGSLAVDASGRRITFIKTSGRLPPDIYTVTLRSATNAFQDTSGALLDGDRNGTAGGNFVQNFTVNAPAANAVAISLPNFARGPQQAVNLPALATTGIPISFSDGGGISTADFELHYNPALLTISTATVAPGLPVGATVNLNTSTPGVAIVQFSSPTPLAAGTTRFIDLQADVPATATYRTKNVLDLTSISLNAGGIPGLDDDALQVAAYFGDVTGNGGYSGSDTTAITRIAVGFESGISTFRLLDPVIIADLSGNGGISSSDSTRSMRLAAVLAVDEAPRLPTPAVSLTQGGPDPKLSIPRDLVARAGEDVTIPVHIDSIVDLTGNGLESADLVLYYDATALDVTSVSLGSLVDGSTVATGIAAGEWFSIARIDPLLGRIFVSVAGQRRLEGFFQGELLQLHGKVKTEASPGSISINLAAGSREPSRYTQLNEGWLTLIPAPTDSADDAIDGRLTILPSPAAPATNRPRAELIGGQLVISGTSSSDQVFVGNIGANLIGVRVNSSIVGQFAIPQRVSFTAAEPAHLALSPALPTPAGAISAHDLALLQLLDALGEVDGTATANGVRVRRR